MNKKKTILSIFILVLITATAIFAYYKFFAPTPIAKIKNHPREFVGKNVRIKGEVTETFSLAFVSYFTITDGTDSIFVYTQKPLPVKGEILKIKGVVKYLTIGNKRLIAIEEK